MLRRVSEGLACEAQTRRLSQAHVLERTWAFVEGLTVLQLSPSSYTHAHRHLLSLRNKTIAEQQSCYSILRRSRRSQSEYTNATY